MTENMNLAVAEYAAATGRHVIRQPQPGDADWRRFLASYNEERTLARLAETNIRFVGRSDDAFPNLLRAAHDPPVGLYIRGTADIGIVSTTCVAVVGARSCSAYGGSVARTMGRDLASRGITVVSGGARGIDAEAHRGVLDDAGTDGRTVVVLGCGIDRAYPAMHEELFRRVVEAGGLIVSEYAPGVEPAPWRFPARNRIIAALSVATVVVEARDRSGALITADLAMEEGREVFAVPGEITSLLSAGTNDLLKLGATVCTGAGDVIDAVCPQDCRGCGETLPFQAGRDYCAVCTLDGKETAA